VRQAVAEQCGTRKERSGFGWPRTTATICFASSPTAGPRPTGMAERPNRYRRALMARSVWSGTLSFGHIELSPPPGTRPEAESALALGRASNVPRTATVSYRALQRDPRNVHLAGEIAAVLDERNTSLSASQAEYGGSIPLFALDESTGGGPYSASQRGRATVSRPRATFVPP
jgi:hypothetical protein